MARLLLTLLALAGVVFAQPKRVLYVTHSAGFDHGSIEVSIPVLRNLSDQLQVTHTEDLSAIGRASLAGFDAVFFFTSGELALSADQKSALLDFVRQGGGFGGVHSATDTLYSWPEYGELIGGYFDGHPWVQEIRIDIEDPDHPASRELAPSFRITDEIYQFRAFSRDRVRVLMTLDPESVDLNAPGVHRDTEDFPLAWVRPYGEGRVFYSALGHFDETWQDPRFQTMLRGALLWLTKQVDGNAAPRRPASPSIAAVGNAASLEPREVVAPGSLISIYGSGLTNGSAMSGEYARRLAGTIVKLNGTTLPLLYASNGQINAYVPEDVTGPSGRLEITGPGVMRTVRDVVLRPSSPGVFAITSSGPGAITVWATGLGRPPASVTARAGGQPARVLFTGPSPEFQGLDQINIAVPAAADRTLELALEGAPPFFQSPY